MEKLDKLKYFLGLNTNSNYINDSFDNSNIRSSITVSSVVIILEVWMILSTFLTQLHKRSTEWIIIHIFCYTVLLISAIILFVYAHLHLKKIIENRKIWKFIRIVFSLISLAFGIYISYLDYLKGEQFITLMTMTILVFGFIV